MRYAIVIETADANYSAYVLDLPGCVATGATADEAEEAIREAIDFHLEGLRAVVIGINIHNEIGIRVQLGSSSASKAPPSSTVSYRCDVSCCSSKGATRTIITERQCTV